MIIQWIRDKLLAIGAILLAVLTVLGAVYNKGRREEEAKMQKESQKQSEKAHDTAKDVEQHIDSLPSPPETPKSLSNGGATRIGDAPPTSAAGKLRDDWSRD